MSASSGSLAMGIMADTVTLRDPGSETATGSVEISLRSHAHRRSAVAEDRGRFRPIRGEGRLSSAPEWSEVEPSGSRSSGMGSVDAP